MIWWLLVCMLVLAQSLYSRRKWRLSASLPPAEKIPSISLLIPARNETHAITRALDSALALDYPRLEIIVLDDQSADNTSEKIRAFAQDGVRFLAGKPLPRGWIGKNWAGHQLLEAASGQYLIFCDVDVVLNSVMLTRTLRLMQARNLSCLSLLPELVLPSKWPAILISLQSWWLQALPLGILHRPPVFGGLMIFKTDDLRRHSGWRRYPAHMLPEIELASDFAKADKYHFLLNGPRLKLLLLKKAGSATETRQRYLWPLYRHYPAIGCLHVGLMLLVLASLAWALPAYLVLVISFAVTARWQIRSWWLSAALLPLGCLIEIISLLFSTWRYASGKAVWRRRRL